jgi:virginiamycin B lyase
MRSRMAQALGPVVAAIIVVTIFSSPGSAQAPAAPAALTGNVSSQVEGAMEGVLVTAQRDGSTISVTVASNAAGQYGFPSNRLEPGKYSVTIRAVGYVLPGDKSQTVQVTGDAPAQLDLSLDKATADQFAHQLTNVDWLNSAPGTPAQKDMLGRPIVNCGFCHDLERITRSNYTADQFMLVIQRMQTYAADNSSGCGTGSAVYCDVKTLGRLQVNANPQPLDGLNYNGADAKALAQYLSSINLSGGKTAWDYSLQTQPRPKGKATNAIVTVFPSPRQPSVIHDLDVDSKGNVWFGDNGWGYLTKLDPKTGKFTEFQAPNTRPEPAAGLTKVVGVQDVQVDSNDNVWTSVYGGVMGNFDTKSETWKVTPLPVPEPARFAQSSSFIPSFHAAPNFQTQWGAGRVPQPDGSLGPLQTYRFNYVTGKFDAIWPIFVDATGKDLSQPRPRNDFGLTGNVRPFCYQIDRDPQDNFFCADYYGSTITTVDAKTGATKSYPTPTPNASPRRGAADDKGNFFFGEFTGDKVGMFDGAAKVVREFPVPVKYMAPYGAAPDNNGDVWASSIGSDRLIRVNPKTGETTLYLMPVYYDSRTVKVDRSATMTTIWLPNKNLSELIRIEVPN